MTDESHPAGFFVTGGTLGREAPSYIKRPADDELLHLTLDGEYCNVLTARQMGKSSLMVRTADRLRAQGRRAVIIDLTAIGSDVTASEWYFGLVIRLARQVELETDEKEWWQTHAERSPVQRFSDFLREVVLEEIKDPIVVFVDEIDSTLKLKFTDDFFASIRAMYNARASDGVYRRLTFVLLGVARPADLIKDRTRTPYNIGVNVDLPDFRLHELKTFLPILDTTHPGQGQDVLSWVLNWTGGQPYLTQKLCAEVVTYPNQTLAETDIDGLAERLFLAKEARNESNLRSIRDRILNSPYLAGMLRVYWRALQGKQVMDEERSLEKNELKLTGVLRATPQGMLEVRNRIYARVFDLDWVKAHTPVSSTQRVAVVTTAVAVLAIAVAGFFFYRQQTQTAEIQAQTFTNGFTNSASPEVRITNLAGLFELEGQYIEQARELFFGLSHEERLALFNLQTPDNVGKELVTVVEGVYQRLENAPQNNELLAAMSTELEQVSAARAPSVVTEITFWLQAREWAGVGRYEDAISQYDKALAKSEERNQPNAGIYIDRAIAYVKLQQYDNALADFEMVVKLDESRSEVVIALVLGEPLLAARWAEKRENYQALSSVMPTLTSAPPNFVSTVPPAFTPTPALTSLATCPCYAINFIVILGESLVREPELALGPPDGSYASIGGGVSELILDMGVGTEIIDGPGVDFYFYERPAQNGAEAGVLLDGMEVAVAQGGDTFTPVFIWGDDDPNNNGTIPKIYLPEVSNRSINRSDLYGDVGTGIGINIGHDDGKIYRSVRFQVYPPGIPDQTSRVEVDAVQRVSHLVTATKTATQTPTPVLAPTAIFSNTPLPLPTATPFGGARWTCLGSYELYYYFYEGEPSGYGSSGPAHNEIMALCPSLCAAFGRGSGRCGFVSDWGGDPNGAGAACFCDREGPFRIHSPLVTVEYP